MQRKVVVSHEAPLSEIKNIDLVKLYHPAHVFLRERKGCWRIIRADLSHLVLSWHRKGNER
jgi:hypothetical protein